MMRFCRRYKSVRVSEFILEHKTILENDVWLSRYNTLVTNTIILQSVNPTYYCNRCINSYLWAWPYTHT